MKSNPSKKKGASGKLVRPAEIEQGGVMEVKSRLQRKQTKHVKFLTKLKEGQRTLSATKSLQKKKRKRTREKATKLLGSISSLADSLPSQEKITKSVGAVHTRMPRNKSYQQAVVRETKQLASVLAHPQFQTNPFLAIQEHLVNTLPAAELPQKKDQEKKKTKSTKKRPSVDQMVE